MDLLMVVNEYLEKANLLLNKIELKDKDLIEEVNSLKNKSELIQREIEKQEVQTLNERLCIFNVVLNKSKNTLELEVFKDYLGRLGVTQEETQKIISDNKIDEKILDITSEYCKGLVQIAMQKKTQND